MKIPSKACIVCGRPVPRRTMDVWVSPVTKMGGIFQGSIEADLRTLADCRRHTNQPYVISATRQSNGLIIRFTVWDGESYRQRGFFCTNRCAQDQGMASAQHGERYTWSKHQ